MNKAETNLMFARWLFPNHKWLYENSSKTDGKVVAFIPGAIDMHVATFDIHNARDREKVMMKLREHGWTITERTRSGETYWQATRQGLSFEHGDLVILLKQVVEGLGK